jgi:glutathione synthase/RimK-type ligase-like ATP-grasp enzyme
MAIANHERVMVDILRAACAARAIAISTLGEGWILRLSRGEHVKFIHGYTFDLNTAATHQVVCDKAATSEALASVGIPCIEHVLFLHPRMSEFVPQQKGNWAAMLALAERFAWDLVVKENTGTGGRGVFRCRDALSLERVAYTLLERNISLCISPYRHASIEARYIFLDGAVELAFTKTRRTVTGDGSSTVLQILAARCAAEGPRSGLASLLEETQSETRDRWAYIPAKGEEHPVNWRHNLGQGAIAQLIDEHASDPGLQRSRDIATRAAAALSLRFGSVDVLLTDQGPQVLEVNGGVMMEFLSRELPGASGIAERIYSKALDAMFDAGAG